MNWGCNGVFELLSQSKLVEAGSCGLMGIVTFHSLVSVAHIFHKAALALVSLYAGSILPDGLNYSTSSVCTADLLYFNLYTPFT